MPRPVVKIEPFEKDGETWHVAVCYTPGCTMGLDDKAWASKVQPIKVYVEDLAKFHRQEHRENKRIISLDSAGPRPEKIRPVETVHLPD
ncbi:hypothetical protein AB0C10_16180 [Microbispora amethystogenes]|uniref:hypothetical protein n=1 Tax=Microbispora amethystogenes TaxID=1427754 RepID=UPI0033EF277F